ncbi:MAG: hypothetical protein L3J41_14830 [Melioribacteraceae bacterium]|nr:hypothetical protein [Melioribacteraceae bacterium]
MKLEIFKVGKHTSSNGITKDYTLDDLNQIVSNHSEPTPIVVGHPKTNSPAFGWIKSLFVKEDSLFAEASDIVPEFLELVKQKIYPNRSASFATNEDGTLQLRHVGFLGGTLPSVKGLEDILFNSDDALEIFEFALNVIFDEAKPNPKKKDGPTAKKVDEQNTNNFSEEFGNLKSEVKKILEFMETLQTPTGTVETSDIQAKIDELNLKIDSAYFQRNMQDKIDFSSLTPAIKTKLEKLLGHFEALDFVEEKSNQVFLDFQELADLIQPFQTDEVLKKVEFEKSVAERSRSEFSEMNVDKDSLKLFNEATQYAKENEVSFSDAVLVLSEAEANVLINNNSEA